MPSRDSQKKEKLFSDTSEENAEAILVALRKQRIQLGAYMSLEIAGDSIIVYTTQGTITVDPNHPERCVRHEVNVRARHLPGPAIDLEFYDRVHSSTRGGR